MYLLMIRTDINIERERMRTFITICSGCAITSLILLLVTIVSIDTFYHPKPKTSFHSVSKAAFEFSKSPKNTISVTEACKATLHPATCELALTGASAESSEDLFAFSVKSAKLRATSARATVYNFKIHSTSESKAPTAAAFRPTSIDDCMELLDITLQLLENVVNNVSSTRHHDVATWLSAALTNQATCAESLSEIGTDHYRKDAVRAHVEELSKYISIALSLHETAKGNGSSGVGGRRARDEFPEWVTDGDRKLLETSVTEDTANAVVAMDGSGTHNSIGEAIASLSVNCTGGRIVIYVKSGVYKENVKIPPVMMNVMLVGEGRGKTIISGSRSVGEGWTTFDTATVAAMGAGFIARELTIINNAGPTKHQAVALMVMSDKSILYQCSILGYQDTLYMHSNRQFYRACNVEGTIDFIFGNAAAVIQNSVIQPRKQPLGQMNTITAQGRTDPRQNTGVVIQRCTVVGSPGGAATYLGRPWKEYARVVFMETMLDATVDAAGWLPWAGDFALSTLYYGEYGNTGPGADTSGRVTWPGVHASISRNEASQFTVANFILGDTWMLDTGVVYDTGL